MICEFVYSVHYLICLYHFHADTKLSEGTSFTWFTEFLPENMYIRILTQN